MTNQTNNCRDYEQTKAIFEKYKPTHVIHLAAIVGGLFKNMRENLRMYRENIMINDNVLRCCSEFGVSSSFIYLYFLTLAVCMKKRLKNVFPVFQHASSPTKRLSQSTKLWFTMDLRIFPMRVGFIHF